MGSRDLSVHLPVSGKERSAVGKVGEKSKSHTQRRRMGYPVLTSMYTVRRSAPFLSAPFGLES